MANIHPLSDCKSEHIGENTNIWQFCVIFKNARIGSNSEKIHETELSLPIGPTITEKEINTIIKMVNNFS